MSIKKHLITIDLWLESYLWLFTSLLLMVLLRLPNFSEPYWYGDEGIYLTIGEALSRGVKLYSEIIDHKTPLIYYLAWGGDQLNFRILLFFWMAATTVFFYHIAHKIIEKYAARLATFLFVVFTSIPMFEGNIPNGELFVMGFVLAGGYVLFQSNWYNQMFEQKQVKRLLCIKQEDYKHLLMAGMLFSLGMLTKVPALFDFAAFVTPLFFAIVGMKRTQKLHAPTLLSNVVSIVKGSLLSMVGSVTPIILSILFFIVIGSGRAYLDFGLLYNFRYSGSWQPDFSSELIATLFTLKGKAVVLFGSFGLLAVFSKYLTRERQFLLSWFILSLFASTLSNRPYPHYFLQVLPPVILMISALVFDIKKVLKTQKRQPTFALSFVSTLISFIIFLATVILLDVRPYETLSYYQNWIKYNTGQLTTTEYRLTFNHLMKDNYEAANIIKRTGAQEIFIWGTNPMLYALSETIPTGRFTVSFHIKDFDAFDETYQSVVQKKPTFIVTMNDEHHSFTELETYIAENYMPDTQFDHFVLWKKQ